jgi:hypothetical protein
MRIGKPALSENFNLPAVGKKRGGRFFVCRYNDEFGRSGALEAKKKLRREPSRRQPFPACSLVKFSTRGIIAGGRLLDTFGPEPVADPGLTL